MHSVVVALICQSLDFKVMQKPRSVSRLLVFAILVDKPDAIQTILGLVITDTKSAPNLFLP